MKTKTKDLSVIGIEAKINCLKSFIEKHKRYPINSLKEFEESTNYNYLCALRSNVKKNGKFKDIILKEFPLIMSSYKYDKNELSENNTKAFNNLSSSYKTAIKSLRAFIKNNGRYPKCNTSKKIKNKDELTEKNVYSYMNNLKNAVIKNRISEDVCKVLREEFKEIFNNNSNTTAAAVKEDHHLELDEKTNKNINVSQSEVAELDSSKSYEKELKHEATIKFYNQFTGLVKDFLIKIENEHEQKLSQIRNERKDLAQIASSIESILMQIKKSSN